MPYEYLATFESAYDGDTITVLLDQGFGDYKRCRIRMRGYDSPEMKAKDPAVRAKAVEARARLIGCLGDRGQNGLRVVTRRTSKANNADATDVYGRYVADVYVGEEDGKGVHVNAWMVECGYGVPFMTD